MAAAKGLLALMGGADAEESASGPDPMAEKGAALREMFAAAKRGDWSGAAASFQEAYDLCAAAHGAEGEDEELEDFALEED
jgi:hypothetical protein